MIDPLKILVFVVEVCRNIGIFLVYIYIRVDQLVYKLRDVVIRCYLLKMKRLDITS